MISLNCPVRVTPVPVLRQSGSLVSGIHSSPTTCTRTARVVVSQQVPSPLRPTVATLHRVLLCGSDPSHFFPPLRVCLLRAGSLPALNWQANSMLSMKLCFKMRDSYYLAKSTNKTHLDAKDFALNNLPFDDELFFWEQSRHRNLSFRDVISFGDLVP